MSDLKKREVRILTKKNDEGKTVFYAVAYDHNLPHSEKKPIKYLGLSVEFETHAQAKENAIKVIHQIEKKYSNIKFVRRYF